MCPEGAVFEIDGAADKLFCVAPIEQDNESLCSVNPIVAVGECKIERDLHIVVGISTGNNANSQFFAAAASHPAPANPHQRTIGEIDEVLARADRHDIWRIAS